MKRALPILGALYAFVAVITYGHAAAQRDIVEARLYADCVRHTKYFCIDRGDRSIITGTFSAIFWPLYWSWEAWS